MVSVAELKLLITGKDEASAALKGVSKNAGELSNVAKASLAVSAGIAGLGAVAIKMAGDFERGMDQVGAISGATKAEMSGLRSEALRIGADTSKSAGEAAAAMEELAAGGRSVSQIMGGEARAAVALSEAGNYGLADSARVVATTMDVWKGTQLATNDVVNRLAGAANASRFGVDDMSQAIAAGGGVARSAGVTFQDFTTAIAATASSFNSGSDAGTSFKTFITSLSGNSEQAKSAIEELGLSFYDAQGALKPMSGIVQELHDKLGPLSQQQQTVYLKQIFGNDAFRTAAGLMAMTGDEFEAMSKQMGNTNAADIAKERMSNLSGQVEQLRGSLETAAITLGTRAIPMLTQAAGVGTEVVNAFSALPTSTQNLVLLSGTAAAALPGLIGLAEKATVRMKGMAAEFRSGRLSASTLAVGIGAVSVALDAILSKTTGIGLVDRIFGDVARIKGGKEALSDWNALLVAAGPNADRVALAQQEFNRVIAEGTKGMAEARGGFAGFVENIGSQASALTGLDREYYKAIDSTKTLQAYTKLLAQQMVASGASSFDLKEVYDQLPPSLQAVFRGVVDVNAAYAASQDNVEAARFAILASNQALEATVGTTPKAVSAVGEWTKTVAVAEDGTKDFKAAIDALQDAFATTNPTVIALNAQHAKLTEELEDLKDKGDAATAAERARIKVIENELLPAIDKEVKGYSDNQDAVEGMSGAVERLLGPDGYGALLDVMGRLKVPQEDQVALLGRISDAYSDVTNNDIPAAITKFGELKGQLSPEVWAAIAEAVGPTLSRKIREGMTGPERDAAVAAAQKLGIDIADGVSQGLSSAANRITATGRGIIIDAIGEMRAAAQTNSPSKLTYQIGIDIAKGAELGILDGIPEAKSAAATFAREIFTTYDMEALKHSYDVVPDYVRKMMDPEGKNRPGEGAKPLGPYIPFDTSWYVGGGQSVLGPANGSDIPIGSYIPGLGYKTENGWEQTLGAAASVDAAYRAGTYGQGGNGATLQVMGDLHIHATDKEDALRSTRDVSFALRAMGA